MLHPAVLYARPLLHLALGGLEHAIKSAHSNSSTPGQQAAFMHIIRL